MARRTPDTQQSTSRPDLVTVRELDARVGTIVSELKWHRYVMFALLAATASPKVGGPSVPAVTAHVVQAVQQFVA